MSLYDGTPQPAREIYAASERGSSQAIMLKLELGEQIATDILDAIRSDRDLYVFDQLIVGDDRLERARKALIERRDAVQTPMKRRS